VNSIKRKRVGILGGSFNPIHNGHLNIAQKAMDQFFLDEIWFMPAWTQPLKQGITVTPGVHRKEMIRLAIEKHPGFSICTYELDKKGISYTCETLQAFCSLYPETDFFFIMGADSVNTFDHWKHPEIICQCVVLLVACRHQQGKEDQILYEQAEQLKSKYQARIEFLDTPFYDISSTQIRSFVQNNTAYPDQDILPDKVLQYINNNGLYR